MPHRRVNDELLNNSNLEAHMVSVVLVVVLEVVVVLVVIPMEEDLAIV